MNEIELPEQLERLALGDNDILLYRTDDVETARQAARDWAVLADARGLRAVLWIVPPDFRLEHVSDSALLAAGLMRIRDRPA